MITYRSGLQTWMAIKQSMMKKILLLPALLMLTTALHAQSGMLLLKKGHKTIDRYFNGDYINCRLESGEWLNGLISKLYNDSLECKPFELVQYLNRLGIPSVDTMWHNKRAIAVSNIRAFPKKNESFSYVKNGTLLQVLGGGYILLNTVNTLSAGDALFADNNWVNLAIAAAVFATGTILHATHKNEYGIGKKYKLEYVALAPVK